MKIKEGKEFKMPQIMFHTVWANFMFVIILGFWLINGILTLVGYDHIPLIMLWFISFGVSAFYLLLIGSAGEAFVKRAPPENFQDFKRSVVYVVLSLFIFGGIHQYTKVEPKPIVLVKEQRVKITDLTIFDTHKKTIKYSIGYKDEQGALRWQSVFDTADSRNNYLGTLVQDNKFKVEIFFKIDNRNKGSLEILKQNIKG